MKDGSGFDDYCEYCECGVANCDGSCEENERCGTCGSALCRGECCDEQEDFERKQQQESLQREREYLEHELEQLKQREQVILDELKSIKHQEANL